MEKSGKSINLTVNYVKMSENSCISVFQHDVHFEPNIDSHRLRCLIMKQESVVAKVGSVMQLAGNNLFLPFKLDDIRITASRPATQAAVYVDIRFIKEAPREELVPFFNTIFRSVMRELEYIQLKRNFFDPKEMIQLNKHQVCIWPGSHQSVKDTNEGLLLNYDSCHKIIRTNTVRDLLVDIKKSVPATFREEALKLLINKSVLTIYNNRTYRIDDIDFSNNPMSSFEYRGGETTFVDYYKNSYQIDIRDKRQPLLLHRKKQRGMNVSVLYLHSSFNHLCFIFIDAHKYSFGA